MKAHMKAFGLLAGLDCLLANLQICHLAWACAPTPIPILNATMPSGRIDCYILPGCRLLVLITRHAVTCMATIMNLGIFLPDDGRIVVHTTFVDTMDRVTT
jgi:hypothetical protein